MTNKNKSQEGAYSQLTGFRRSVPIILIALAVFTGLCFVMKDTGALGKAISNVFLGLFSISGYFIPALLVIHAIFYPSDVQKKRTVSRLIFSAITVIAISTLTHSITHFGEELVFAPKDFYRMGKNVKGGGFIGGTVAFVLTKIFGTVGLIIVTLLVFALYITYFFPSAKAAVSRLLLRLLNGISRIFSSMGKRKSAKKNKKATAREKRRREALAEQQDLLLDDEFFAADNGMKELTISELGIKEIRDDKDIELNPTLQNKVFHNSDVDSGYNETFERQRNFDTDYGADFSQRNESASTYGTPHDIIYDISNVEADKSADDFFSRDFDAFDLKLNQELMNKPSSKAKKQAEEFDGISEFAEPLTEISEEDVEKARQRADFEMKKKAAIDAQRRYAEAQAELEARRREAEQQRIESTSPPEEETHGTPYVPEYMQAPEEEPCVQPEEEKDETELFKINFASAMDDYEKDRETEAEFKEYSPYKNEIFSPENSDAEEEKTEELKITRTMLDPSPNMNEELFEEEYEVEDVDGESIFEFDSQNTEDGETLDYEEIPESEQSEEVKQFRKLFTFLNDEEEKEKQDLEDTPAEQAVPEKEQYSSEQKESDKEDDEPPFETKPASKSFFEKMQERTKPTPAPAPAQTAEKPDYSDYQFPPLDLLIKGKNEEDLNQEEEKNQNAEKLVDALLQFNVRISIKGIDRGPRITRYEIVPARGVKVQSVTNLFNDIALNLGAEGIRMEAPIPGKSAIGVEIPNKKPSTVLLRDLVESDDFISAESKTMSCLGKDVTGNPVFADIAKMPHVLVAGATGMGKSVCINSILISILYKARPDEVKFIMIDPKKVEFNGYNGIPHLLVPVVTDVKQAAGALMWAVEQMEKRYDLMESLEVRKLDAYNEKVRANPELGEPLPKIVIVIDELNDIMLQVRKPAEDLIMSIAQKARAAGIHLIIGTQRPSVDVITGVIKANIPSRISCKVASYNDSKTILEQAGAEKLLNNGDMLYIPAGAPKAIRVQGAFVSDGEVAAIMKFLKSQAKGNIYDSQALEEINRAAQKCSKGKGGDDFDDDDDGDGDNIGVLNDQQFLDAVELAVKSGKISTSLIQRKISIGYGKAAKFIDIMEEMGIVSEPNGQRPRDVLITRDEWHEMLARRSLD